MASSLKMLMTVVSLFSYINVSGQDDATQLETARNAFNTINNGCYEFQYSQSCFCFTCSTQSMDIQVSNNEVQQVTFAEGNDFALDNFCGGNEDYFGSVLQSASRTIDDLFDLIDKAINADLPFSVTYHKKIGIPLSLYIDREPGAIDDEVTYSINCVQFDMTCPAMKKMTDEMKKFNKKDDYSCTNIETPDECPVDRFECNRFFDGCNTCSCDGLDTIACSKRVCYDYAPERCLDCESNTQWDTCGNICDPTCQDTDDLCGLLSSNQKKLKIRFTGAPDCEQPRCQCPDAFPRWDGSECVTVEECTPSQIIGQQFCVDNCAEYTDGCMTCQCDENGAAVQCDAISAGVGCVPGFITKETCNKCQDVDSMTYTTCGGCDTTCDSYLNNEISMCLAVCQHKCQCNKDTPLLVPEQGRCVSKSECKSMNNIATDEPISQISQCPTHCMNYFDGCNDCNCATSNLAACTLKFCSEPSKPTCSACEDDETMEYTTCGGCDKTCDNLAPMCTKQCRFKCQCKSDTPIYDPVNKKCITQAECPNANIGTNTSASATVAQDAFVKLSCPTHCVEFFDGCNDCKCGGNINDLMACMQKVCSEREIPTCSGCEDDQTMEFTTCGGCDKTCDNPNPRCTKECKVKCQCKQDTPIYDPVNKKCITFAQCNDDNDIFDNDLVYGENLSASNDSNYGLVFVILLGVAVVIFGVYMFYKYTQRTGYEKIDSKKVMPLHSMNM